MPYSPKRYQSVDNRYYSPVYGRFTSPDPYQASGGPADPGSWNRYQYVLGDPITYFDPNGLDHKIPDVTQFNPSDPRNVDPGGTSVTISGDSGWVIEFGHVPCSHCKAPEDFYAEMMERREQQELARLLRLEELRKQGEEASKKDGKYGTYASCLISAAVPILGKDVLGIGFATGLGRAPSTPVSPPADLMRRASDRLPQALTSGLRWGTKGQVIGVISFGLMFQADLRAAAKACSDASGYVPWAFQ